MTEPEPRRPAQIVPQLTYDQVGHAMERFSVLNLQRREHRLAPGTNLLSVLLQGLRSTTPEWDLYDAPKYRPAYRSGVILGTYFTAELNTETTVADAVRAAGRRFDELPTRGLGPRITPPPEGRKIGKTASDILERVPSLYPEVAELFSTREPAIAERIYNTSLTGNTNADRIAAIGVMDSLDTFRVAASAHP